MKLKDVLNKYNISDATVRNWKKLKYIEDINDIKEEEIEKVLRNKVGVRRNKRNSAKSIIPLSYIEDKKIVNIITSILELKEEYNVSNNEILQEVICKILNARKIAIPDEVHECLGKRTNNKEFLNRFDTISMTYDDGNDFLGCLYMSLLSVGKKDVNGIYYTPFKVVDKIISSISFKAEKDVIDPGCGSANFLIQAYKKMKLSGISSTDIVRHLYGYDIDKIAVLLAKINIYILDNNIKWNEINILERDFLNAEIEKKFDIIIGNPPWGKKYTDNEKKQLKKSYGLEFSKMDSFAQFIIRSFEIMNESGTLAFVLPSSILNIATHEGIRRFLLNSNIEYIQKIGREFEEVVTDVIILKVNKGHSNSNYCMYDAKKVKQNDFMNNPYCNFLIEDDISKRIINKLKNTNSFHLTDGVEYALGIVTGDNEKYLSEVKNEFNEMIISGKDIRRYNIDYSKVEKYIVFEKEKFQQVAKESLYRWRNKIIYKFIGKKLCFAAEQHGVLTLNSANLICLPKDYDLFYIVAILNSRVTQLYFEDTYSTHKVLKNHIQSFYIPIFSDEIMKKIANICKKIKNQDSYCEKIEDIIYTNLELTQEEREYLKNRI